MSQEFTTTSGTVSSSDAAWLGRLIARVEGSLDKLADKVSGLEQAISADMKDMREGHRREIQELENRVSVAEARLAQMDVFVKILSAIGGAALVVMVGIMLPNMLKATPGSSNSIFHLPQNDSP